MVMTAVCATGVTRWLAIYGCLAVVTAPATPCRYMDGGRSSGSDNSGDAIAFRTHHNHCFAQFSVNKVHAVFSASLALIWVASPADFWHDHGPSVPVQGEILQTKIIEFGAGRPDFGGRWPRGEVFGTPQKERVAG